MKILLISPHKYYFQKILLDRSLWIFNWVRWWCHTLPFITHVLHEIVKNTILGQMRVKVYPCYEICQDIQDSPLYWAPRWQDLLPLTALNKNIFVILCKWRCRKFWGLDIITSPYWIFIRTGCKMFSENIENLFIKIMTYFLSKIHDFCTIW